MTNKTLLHFLFGNQPLPPELLDKTEITRLTKYLGTQLKETEYGNKMILLEPGSLSEKVYYVNQGIVRGFTYDKISKKQKTSLLWFEHALVTDATSFIQRTASNIFIEVIHPNTVLLCLTFTQVEQMVQIFPYTISFLINIMQNELYYSNKELLAKDISAWDRLEELRQKYPKLEKVVRKEIIASFLNIAPQHLSRMYRTNQ